MASRPFDEIGAAFDTRWHHHDASRQSSDLALECDVVIIGTGAGGGTAAYLLAQAGLDVVMLEEGPLRTARDFVLEERAAYPGLYQEAAARKTADKAIGILQGRAVGGSTLVNWTTSLRTPEATLAHWRKVHGWMFAEPQAMAPWFAAAEQRHAVAPWALPPNENNGVLARGLHALGGQAKVVPRNVHGCWNLGACGMGCPTNAKQSSLVALLPAALERGAKLVSRARVERLQLAAGQVVAVDCCALDELGQVDRSRRVTVRSRHVVLAAGAIGSPAVLLRSAAPDPYDQLGRRTFLHPVVLSSARMPTAVNGHAGAPQTVYSDDYLWPADGSAGFKLEVPPIHPLIAALVQRGHGAGHRQAMRELDHAQITLALMRDGFHDDSRGGAVRLDGYGDPVLDYPMTPYLFAGMRRAYLAMAEIQFAAGALAVSPVHDDARAYRSWGEARAAIGALPMQALRVKAVSAHVMGGCAMSGDERLGVVDLDGRHHQIENLSLCDGSIFPTSIGANPQLSIYAFAARIAAGLGERLANPGREGAAVSASGLDATG